jgi:hypothetical protein
MNNTEKEKWLASADKKIFEHLPSNYDAIMNAVGEVAKEVSIGNPVKITTRVANPYTGIGEAGILVLGDKDGIKEHKHTIDREIYSFEDGTAQACGAGCVHEIKPGKKQIVKFDKRFEKVIDR